MVNKEILIKQSHKRCETYGVKKSILHSKKILPESEMLNKLQVSGELINISTPYIHMLYDTLEDKEFIIILTDSDGCILSIHGDNNETSKFQNYNLTIGTYMNEENIGTNAMGTALTEDRGVQVTASEHYIELFHELTCSAAPIHNIDGQIIGTLNLTSNKAKQHDHTLGLIIFAAKTIEKEIQRINSETILNKNYNYMETIISNADTGLILVDSKNVITNINEHGSNILGNIKDNFIGLNITSIINDWDNIVESFNLGADVINKDIKFNNLFTTLISIRTVNINDTLLGYIIKLKDSKTDLNSSENKFKYTFEDIIGDSRLIKNVISNCKLVANSPSTILIEGESGTGKEVMAQSIHNYSLRRNKPFIAINCGAIPNNLIESELFGYEEGTFTGGKKGGKKGKFELAHGGTIFLDEIGEMPMEMQVNLLRVLQEGKIIPLGGDHEIPIDVRIIAATNRDLKTEVLKGNFREDLYYRLCVIPVYLPPLRERLNDVPTLINYFLRIKSAKLEKSIPTISDSLYQNLLCYNWPGNIRQLENIIENIVNLDGKLSFDLIGNKETNFIKQKHYYQMQETTSDIFELDEIERAHIIKVLKIFNNNICKTSSALKISRNTLYNKIKKYKISMF